MNKRREFHAADCLKHIDRLKKMSDRLVVSLSPAIGKRMAQACMVPYSEEFEERLIYGVYKIGADYVLSLAESAEMVLREEARALNRWLEQEREIPYITGFCPAGADSIKKCFPDLEQGISAVKSPAARQDRIVRDKLGHGIKLSHIIVVPCEPKRKEVRCATNEKLTLVLTGEELFMCLKSIMPDFEKLERRKFDHILCTQELHPENGIADMVMELAAGEESASRFGTAVAVKGKKEFANLRRCINMGGKFDYIEILACTRGCIGDDK